MTMLRTGLIRSTKYCFLFLCLTISISAQINADNRSVTASFDRKIDEGKLTEVETGLFNYVIANPKDANGFSLLGKLRLKQNRLSEAKSLLNRALALDPTLLPAKLTLAQVDFQSGEIEQARAILNGINESDLSTAALRSTAARTSALVGDCARALVFSEKLPEKIKNGEALSFRAACYLESGDQKNFASLIPIARISARQNPALAIEFATVSYKAAMHKETADLLRLVVAGAPRNVEALILLAKSEIGLRDYANAKLHLGQAERIEPKSAELLFLKAVLESEKGNNASSLELLEKSLAESPDNVQALARFVVVALRANENGKAVRAAGKLLILQPANPDYLYLHGIASLQNNNVQQAEKSLKRFLEARPNDSLGCLALGLTFAAQTDRLGEARGQMEKCLAINPSNFEAAYQLGLSYKVQGETAKAIEYLEQTVRLSPEYAAALRDLGAVYLQSGGETKARPVLEKAVMISPNDADTHFQLSRLYNLLGERERGKKHLEIFQKLKTPKKDGM